MADDIRLNEFDKAEWFDVARNLKPDLTEAEYEEMWGQFQRDKARRRGN